MRTLLFILLFIPIVSIGGYKYYKLPEVKPASFVPPRVNAFGAVQTAGTGSSGASSLSITVSSTTLNNIVVVSIAAQGTTNVTSVTDNQSNSYVRIGSGVGISSGSFIVYQYVGAQSTGGATSITVNFASSVSVTACADEYSGFGGGGTITSTSVQDATTSGSGSGTSLSVSTLTPSATGNLVVASLCAYAANSYTAGTGYTIYGTGGSAIGFVVVRSEYKLSSAATETAPATVAYAVDLGWAEIATSYKIPAVYTRQSNFFFKP